MGQRGRCGILGCNCRAKREVSDVKLFASYEAAHEQNHDDNPTMSFSAESHPPSHIHPHTHARITGGQKIPEKKGWGSAQGPVPLEVYCNAPPPSAGGRTPPGMVLLVPGSTWEQSCGPAAWVPWASLLKTQPVLWCTISPRHPTWICRAAAAWAAHMHTVRMCACLGVGA